MVLLTLYHAVGVVIYSKPELSAEMMKDIEDMSQDWDTLGALTRTIPYSDMLNLLTRVGIYLWRSGGSHGQQTSGHAGRSRRQMMALTSYAGAYCTT